MERGGFELNTPDWSLTKTANENINTEASDSDSFVEFQGSWTTVL